MNSSQEVAASYGYTPRPIDVDLGVIIRDAGAGRVIMYAKKPGMYLNVRGGFVSDEDARAAGFDIELDRRKAAADGKIAEYNRAVRLAQAENEARIRAGLAPEVERMLPPPQGEAKPVPARSADIDLITDRNTEGEARGTADFVLQHIGGGRWNVLSREDQTSIESRLVIEDAIKAMVKAQEALNESRS